MGLVENDWQKPGDKAFFLKKKKKTRSSTGGGQEDSVFLSVTFTGGLEERFLPFLLPMYR